MLNRRNLLAFTALALVPSFAYAAKIPAYSEAAFKAAQKDGKSILIHIHADWCPTCRAQAPIIDTLLKADKFKKLVVFRMDFDGQAADVRAMGAQSQSTLITFKGDQETGRTVGDTNPASIAALMATAI